jgi:hypothetical protein
MLPLFLASVAQRLLKGPVEGGRSVHFDKHSDSGIYYEDKAL